MRANAMLMRAGLRMRLPHALLIAALLFSLAATNVSDVYAKAVKKSKAKSASKRQPQARAQAPAKFKLKSASIRVKNFFNALYYALREMGYSKRQSLNAAFTITVQAWRESNMYGNRKGVAYRIFVKYGVINPTCITVLPSMKGVWSREWENGRRVWKKWAAWYTEYDAAQGIVAYLLRMHPEAFKKALQGNIAGYADALGDGGYYTGDAEEYKSIMLACAGHVKGLIEQ